MAAKEFHGMKITGKQTRKYASDKDRVKRIPFGLNTVDLTKVGSVKDFALSGSSEKDFALAAAQKCIRCSFGNVPVIEEVVWTIPLPLTAEEALSTFGDQINLLGGNSSVAGVASVDSTFLVNGILQTDILTQGVGVHVFHEPMSFSSIGNAFVAPSTDTVPPPSPDVFTVNDLANGAFPDTVETDGSNFFPADFEWGVDVWRAGWNFINAYQFQWRASQRELILNELAADVSYFGSFADAEAAGTSEVAIQEFVAITNAIYRSKSSQTIFLPVNFRRVGSTTTLTTNNVGVFHPTRDYDLSPVTWGGLRWQGYGCRGQMYRQVESPCFLERGIPIGMLFQVQDAVHQAQMLEAVTINNEPLGINVSPDENLSDTTATGAAVMLEQTLDATPANVPQQTNVSRQVFKGGILKLAIKIKGWEMPGGWKAFCADSGLIPKAG